MIANRTETETELVDQAVAWLQSRLPESWTLERLRSANPKDDRDYADSMLSIQGGGFNSRIAIEAKQSLSPREASNILPRVAQVLQSMSGGPPILVIAPWLSRRTQDLLTQQGIGYLDLTGNARIEISSPAVYIEAVGATRDPKPKDRGQARLRGPKAARLIRVLVDVTPPYGVRELAVVTGLTPGYVSRLLDTLYRESLVERSARGGVESVEAELLLRRWADSYDVFKNNDATTFIAPLGVDDLLLRIGETPSLGSKLVVTGSIAASRLAPVTAPAVLLAYCETPEELATEMELLPADEGANVILLKPFDPVVWERTSTEIALRFAAPAQVAVDCLTGNGRMPAEGEAILEWMRGNELDWRLPALNSEKRDDDESSDS